MEELIKIEDLVRERYIGEFNIVGSHCNPHRIDFDSGVIYDFLRGKTKVVNFNGRKYKVKLNTDCLI